MNKPILQHNVQTPSLNVALSNLYAISTAPKLTVAPLKLSVSQLTTRRWKLNEEVDQLKREGFDSIGLYRPKIVEFGDERAAEMIHKAKMSVASLSFAGGFTGSRGFGYLEAIEDGYRAIDQAKTLSAKNLIIVSGARNLHTANHCRRMAIDGIRKLADYSASDRVQLCLLPMHRYFGPDWTFLHTLDATLDLINDVDRPSVRLAFDTYHLQDESRLVERIPEIAAMTGIVQLSDGLRSPASDRDRLMPGHGTLPLKNLIRAFQLTGYTGHFDIQVWSSKVWQSNYSQLLEQSYAELRSMSVWAGDCSLECLQESR